MVLEPILEPFDAFFQNRVLLIFSWIQFLKVSEVEREFQYGGHFSHMVEEPECQLTMPP